jgi:hypothetical protein
MGGPRSRNSHVTETVSRIMIPWAFFGAIRSLSSNRLLGSRPAVTGPARGDRSAASPTRSPV